MLRQGRVSATAAEYERPRIVEALLGAPQQARHKAQQNKQRLN